MPDTLFWTRWGHEWRRWAVEAPLDLDEVRRLERPARHNKGNGGGAWYQFIPAVAEQASRILLFTADGACRGAVRDAPPVRWHHLRGCDCEQCSPLPAVRGRQ